MKSSEFGVRNSELRQAALQIDAMAGESRAALRTPHSAFRTGISLLEVLICIGIVAIGLVSIAALIPVGGVQVQKSNVEERKATLGLNAFREFQIRGMDNVQNWVRYNSSNWVNYLPLSLTASSFPLASGFTDFPYLPPVAIDPQMAAVGQSQGSNASISTFPANYGSGPLMARLTLNSFSSYSSPNYTPIRSLADAVFTSADDVVATQPNDVSQPGTGVLDSTGSKRDYQGEFTWLATITPNSANQITFNPTLDTATIQPPQMTNQYTLSIVVFDRRVLSTPVAATSEQGQEEMVQAHWPTLGTSQDSTLAVSGGEFTLTDSSSNASAKLGMVRPDQWIMLCRYLPYTFTYGSTTPPSYAYFPYMEAKWYRVVAAGNITQSGTTYSRQITLAGPDWEADPTAANVASPSTLYIAPTSVTWPSTVSTGSQNYNTYACLFDGAVAVYQRVIHLEGPSVWNQ
jgi:hypothetical protein